MPVSVSVARLLLSHRAIALLRRTLAAPPLVLNRVTTFGLSWFDSRLYKTFGFKGGWVGFEFARVGGKTKGFINTKSLSEVWVDRWVKGEGKGGSIGLAFL